MAKAIIELYGKPNIVPLYESNKKPKYDAEQKLLYVSLTFANITPDVFNRTIALEFTDSKQGERVFQVLEKAQKANIIPKARINWTYKDNALAIKQASIAWNKQWIAGNLASDEDFKNQPVTVTLADKSQLTALEQNTALQDVAFDIYLTEQEGFNDDIPALLAKTTAADIDTGRWLFVIGAGKYRETANIIYSRRSAELFAKTAAKVFGIAKNRQTVLLDEGATSGAVQDKLRNMLKSLRAGDSLYFYYSGHGIPNPTEDNAPYLLPVDAEPNYVSDKPFFRVENIYKLMLASTADKVFAFMDSCFTGKLMVTAY